MASLKASTKHFVAGLLASKSSGRAFSHTTSWPYRVDPPVTSGEGDRAWIVIGAIVGGMRSHSHQSWPAVCPATAERIKGWHCAGPCELARWFGFGCCSYPCHGWQHFISCRTFTHIRGLAEKSPNLPVPQHGINIIFTNTTWPTVFHPNDFHGKRRCR